MPPEEPSKPRSVDSQHQPALVAQWIRASDYGSEGWGFESLRARFIRAGQAFAAVLVTEALPSESDGVSSSRGSLTSSAVDCSLADPARFGQHRGVSQPPHSALAPYLSPTALLLPAYQNNNFHPAGDPASATPALAE